MLVLIAALIVTGGLAWLGLQIEKAADTAAAGARRMRVVQILATFAPALDAAARDPRAILVWQALARAGRQVCAEEFALLDRAAEGAFPFSRERIEVAHARWTADWLAWERTHDAEYKLKAAAIEAESSAAGAPPLFRARVDAVEREKLDLYQRRYEEYVRVAKALQALIG